MLVVDSHCHLDFEGMEENLPGLLQRAEAVGLLPAGVGQEAADAYREMRHLQHRARLDEAPTQIDAAQAEPLAAAVRALWAHVLG